MTKLKQTTPARHPLHPLYVDDGGYIRFKRNVTVSA